VHVRIDADVLQALEREDQDQVGCLAADARQREELVHRPGHPATVLVYDDPAGFFQVLRLVAVEADGIDEALDPFRGELRHRFRRAGDAEQPGRRRGGDRIPRLRREHCRDEDFEGILLALFGDLFDGRQLEIVDRTRQCFHDAIDSS